jgi:hypothetical protein
MESLAKQFRFRHLDSFWARWAEIRDYNAGVADRLPQGAKALALAEWHYDASDPRCPHDAWIRSLEIRTDDSKVSFPRANGMDGPAEHVPCEYTCPLVTEVHIGRSSHWWI